MDRIEDVGAPVTETSGAMLVPSTPIAGMKHLAKRMHWCRTVPQIPVHGFWRRLAAWHRLHVAPRVPTTPLVHVGIDVGDVFDDAGILPSIELKMVVARVSLVTHLGRDFVFLLCRHHQFDFLERASEWLFGVDMFASGHGCHRDRKVRMVWHQDHHRIDVLVHLVQHHPPILKDACLGKFFFRRVDMWVFRIDVTEGDEVGDAGSFKILDNARAAVTNAAPRDVHFFIRA